MPASPHPPTSGHRPALRPRRPARVVVVGSINMDLVVRASRFPRPGETLPGTEFATLPGGKGANQAVAIARLGGRAVLIGQVGSDAFGLRLRNALRENDVDIRHVRTRIDQPSGTAVITVESATGQNAITLVPGANGAMDVAALQRCESVIAQADALLLQLEIPLATVAAALEIARRHQVPTVLDCAPAPEPSELAQLPPVDVLTPNETEAERLTGLRCSGRRDAERAGRKLIERFDPGVVILKRGEQGSMATAGTGEYLHVPAFRVRPVDTTAAGDAFTAALVLRLAEGADLGEALRFANAAGALAVLRPGAQDAMPTRREVTHFLRKQTTVRGGRNAPPA